MKNVILLAGLLLAPLVTLCAADTLSATAPSSAVKKGAAGQAKDAGSLYLESGVSWTYNWHPAPSSAMPAGVEFVPMIWGKRDIPEIEAVEKKDGVLLGFNEPEREKQANMTVEEALELWPKLEATKMRLGSPAPAGGGARAGGRPGRRRLRVLGLGRHGRLRADLAQPAANRHHAVGAHRQGTGRRHLRGVVAVVAAGPLDHADPDHREHTGDRRRPRRLLGRDHRPACRRLRDEEPVAAGYSDLSAAARAAADHRPVSLVDGGDDGGLDRRTAA